MTVSQTEGEDGISVFRIATVLLRNGRRLMTWMLVGGFLAGLTVLRKPKEYSAFASFIPQASESARPGLASLAGQFGLTLPTSVQPQSPDFYANLIESRVVLERIAIDTFTVTELGNDRRTFYQLFEIEGSPAEQLESGVKTLDGIVDVRINKQTGIVSVAASTQWRSVSLAIVDGLLGGVNDYNQASRQTQARSEREFVQQQAAVASQNLRQAEDRLQQFLQANRRIGSTQLEMQRDRLQREVTLRQQVYTSLMQALDDARIREVRDTPLISIVERPWASVTPQPRGRVKRVAFGMLLAAGLAVLVILSVEVTRNRQTADEEARLFAATVSELGDSVARRIPLLRSRPRRPG